MRHYLRAASDTGQAFIKGITGSHAFVIGVLMAGGCVQSPVLPDASVAKFSTAASSFASTPAYAITDASALHPAIQTIANDFVKTLQALLPRQPATFQVSAHSLNHATDVNDPITQRFYQAVIALLEERGIALQQVSHDQGAYTLAARVSQVPNDDSTFPVTDMSGIYELSVGPLTLTRAYRQQGDVATADAVFAVEVVTASGGGVTREIAEQAVQLASTDAALDLHHISVVSEGVRQFLPGSTVLPRSRYAVAPVVLSLDGARQSIVDDMPERTAVNTFKLNINNLYYTNESNFVDVLDGYQPDTGPASQQTLVFSDTRMVLSDQHHAQLVTLLSEFDPSTDVITLLGSSTEPTDYPDGNRGLAMGRSAQVVDYLLTAGVSRTRIYEEGCWAGHALNERYPRSAVIARIHRRV